MSVIIPDKLFFKIGEAAEIVGLEQHVLRYWEDEFDVLKPSKNRSGQRLYQKKDIERILKIKRLLYTEKFTLAGAKKKLKERKKKDDQMGFGFENNQFLKEWKKKAKRELTGILKILDKKK